MPSTTGSDEEELIIVKMKAKKSSHKKHNSSPSKTSQSSAPKVHELSDSEDESHKKHSLSPSKTSQSRLLKVHELSDSEDESSKKQTPTIRSPVKLKTKEKITDYRPPCVYGDKCYRKNPDHLKAFSHKRSCEEVSEKSTASTSQDDTVKRQKVENMSVTPENPFNFFLTTVKGISPKYNDSIAHGIRDLLSPSRGKLKSSAQFNYLFDVPWLMEQYPKEFRKCPLTIVHGEQRQSKKALEFSGSGFPNIKFCQAKLDIPYGTHHTKMMFLLYEEGLRIVIHTSNIVDSDWLQRTQGMWISPMFPPLKNGPSMTEGESSTKFKSDIIEYVVAYQAGLDDWCTILKNHDMSAAKVFIIGSVPGRHIGSRKTAFGHLKLRKVLNANGPTADITHHWPVIGQFSSIGSLGAAPDQWMCGEWLASLTTVKSQSAVTKKVYPCVENVRKSLEGYPAGASLPYSIKVATKQPYLKDFLHQWKSDRMGRSEASPHIKTYLRLSPSGKKIAWFLVTSANLSKAAWGALEKKDSQLMIRSYELGVLFLPKYFSQELFEVPSGGNSVSFPVPYDLPLSRYGERDEPWIWDIPHVYAPDRNGNKWCPP